MINHFHAYLLNRPAEFFRDSLFPVPVSAGFKASPWDDFTRQIDRILFGDSPDASLLDYRFFQFLRIISGVHLGGHVCRFDSRTIHEEPLFSDEMYFQPSVTPAQGLVVTEIPDRPPSFLRRRFSVFHHAERNIPLTVFLDGDRLTPVKTTPLTNNSCYVESLGLTLTGSRSGSWVVDYRVRPQRPVEQIVQETLEEPLVWELFGYVRECVPEYEDGFRTITDSLTKFCMVLFAQAAANERMKDAWDKTAKRIAADTSLPSLETDGTFYYGSSPRELMRMVDVKKELQHLSPVRSRRQTVEISVPTFGYIYLGWPVRFGLLVRNRLIVDGLLNSAWAISYADDLDEQYVLFRSFHQIRTETPVRVEVP
jgi:hypothetical protein